MVITQHDLPEPRTDFGHAIGCVCSILFMKDLVVENDTEK